MGLLRRRHASSRARPPAGSWAPNAAVAGDADPERVREAIARAEETLGVRLESSHILSALERREQAGTERG